MRKHSFPSRCPSVLTSITPADRRPRLRSEVVVSSGCLVGVEVGWRDEPGNSRAGLDGPLFFVDQVVMVGTQERSVVCAGGTAVGPVGDVVGFAPGGGDGAAGEGAALVSGGDGSGEGECPGAGEPERAGARDLSGSVGVSGWATAPAGPVGLRRPAEPV